MVLNLPKIKTAYQPGDELIFANGFGNLYVKGFKAVKKSKCSHVSCETRKPVWFNYKIVNEDDFIVDYFMLCDNHQLSYLSFIVLQNWYVIKIGEK